MSVILSSIIHSVMSTFLLYTELVDFTYVNYGIYFICYEFITVELCSIGVVEMTNVTNRYFDNDR